MANFITQNKKSLLLVWAAVAIPLTAMMFCALPYLSGPPADTDEIIILLAFGLGMPLFCFGVIFIKWLIYI